MGKDNKKDLHVIYVSGDYLKIHDEVDKNRVKLINNPENIEFYKKMQKAYPEFKTPYMTIFKNGNFIVFSDSIILGNLTALENQQKIILEDLIDKVASCKAPVYGLKENSIATIVQCCGIYHEYFPVTMEEIAKKNKYNVITHEIDYTSNLEIKK